MGHRFQIAWRYLAGRRRFSLISIITSISTGGVALGVAALIVVLSVMNGFYDFVRDVLVSRSPHVVVTNAADGTARGLPQADSLAKEARRLRYVTGAAPYVEGRALVMPSGSGVGAFAEGDRRIVQVRGIPPAEAGRIDSAGGAGALRRPGSASSGALPGALVSAGLAGQLGLSPRRSLPDGFEARDGSRLPLLSAPAIEQTFTQIFGGAPTVAFEVRGTYDEQSAYDERRVYVAYREAQRLFQMEGRATGLGLRLTDLDRADEVKAALQRRLGDDYRVETWYDLRASLYDVMRSEKWVAWAILLLIIVVAAFNIVGSMMMIVIEKQRDIGALKAMGASEQDVRRIFLNEGLLIGAVGTGAGLAVGLGLAFLQKEFSLVPMTQAESFLIDAYPVAVRPLDVALIAAAAMALCVGAAVYPAHRAARVAPARAVQGE
ncbi:MAG: permease [Bacteroidetes bacterium QS_9_68_14]|nr:MAG: permease [Bacteroidetes bacterium QS_9_68_14]